LEIELSDFEAVDATLKGDFLWEVVEIVIGGVPRVLVVRCMYMLMSLGRLPFRGSVSSNMLGPKRHQVDLLKVKGST
jgi:hypothetical protein